MVFCGGNQIQTMNTKDSNFAVALIGEHLISVEGLKVGSTEVIFKTASGRTFKMYHEQDCCESVNVTRHSTPYTYGEGLAVKEATEKIEQNIPASESATRTTFCINGGSYSGFFIEWVGESNGYYSESVSFVEIIP